MDYQYNSFLSDEEKAARRAQRAKVRRKKQLVRRRRLLLQCLPVVGLSVAVISVLTAWASHRPGKDSVDSDSSDATPPVEYTMSQEPDVPGTYSVTATSDTVQLTDAISSSYGILIDLQSNTILAEKAANTRINPASMTKVLTLLVAAEHITNLDDTVTMTTDITDYCYVNDCSVVGLDVGETASIKELLYGVILPSGADASLALANYVAGSHEAFVKLMNQKLEELGLSETSHFTNCVGLYDEKHYCTVYDMAMILKAAMDNELCREVLNARSYKTLPTQAHPDGQILSNWFLRRIEDKDTGDINVVGAKTGYVVQSGSCAASSGQDPDGHLYICVTGDAGSSWQAIYDHVALYKTYCN